MNVFQILKKSLRGVVAAALLICATGLPLSAHAAAIVQQQNGRIAPGPGFTTLTLNIVMPSPVASGAAIAIAAVYGGSVAPTLTSIFDDKGNKYKIDQNITPSGAAAVVTAHALNVTNAPQTISVTITAASSSNMGISGTAYEISPAAVVDVNATCEPSSCNNANPFVASFTTTASSEVGIIADVTNDSSATFTQNNGWTTDTNDGFTGGLSFHKILTSSGANSINATSSVTVGNFWAVLTFSTAPFAPIFLNNGSDRLDFGTGLNTPTGDSIDSAAVKLVQWATDFNIMLAQLYPQRSIQTPTTGFSIAVAAGITQLVLNPTGTLATGTITFPKNPGDNQPFELMTSQTVTSLTVNTSDGSSINGAPTTITANAIVKYWFVASLNTWFREK